MYINIAKKTLESLSHNKSKLFNILLIPLLLFMFIEYFYSVEVIKTLDPINLYFLIAVSFFINIIVSIAVHRVLLLKDKKISTFEMYRFGKGELNFTFKAIVIGFLIGLLFMLLFFISTFLGKVFESLIGLTFAIYFNIISIVLVSIFCGLVFSRFSLVFPAIAIGKPIDLYDAFTLSKKYKMILFICVIVFPVFFGSILSVVYGLVIGFLMDLISTKLSILFAFLNLFITVFTIGFLSTTYEYIISKEEILEEIKEAEKTVEPLKEILIQKSKDIHKVNIHETHNTTFDELKDELILQYEKLGFSENAIDRENKWMIKNPDDIYSYVLLSFRNDEYEVETYNTQEPKLKIMLN